MIDAERLSQSQQILAAFAPHVRMWWNRGFFFGWHVNGVVVQKRWKSMSKGSDYPTWYNERPFGGTAFQACTQLMRWARRKPVLPLRTWRYWCGDSVGMNAEAARLAESFGWPESVPCIFCGKAITPQDRLDWFSFNGADGPGCYYTPECKAAKNAVWHRGYAGTKEHAR